MDLPTTTRAADRRITLGGVTLAATYLALAGASLALPDRIRLGTWLPLHLLLAGAATTAIAAVLPFFTTTLAGARPAHPAIRIGAIALVAGGGFAAMTGYGHGVGSPLVAIVTGVPFLAGLGLVAIAAFGPLRGALGVRRWPIELAYAVALAQVVVGATIALLLLGGHAETTAGWLMVKPAHAWLNAFGFIGLTVAATLVHLAPTVTGSRIRLRPTALVALATLGAGPPIVAAGHIIGADQVARLGGLLVATGGVALATHGLAVQRGAGRWTTELAWHRFAAWSLLAGSAWFALAAGVAGIRLAVLGPGPATWSLPLVAGPLLVGFAAQVLVGAWTHLVPAIGPGDRDRHARQRAVLATAYRTRLVLLNGGCAVLWIGALAGQAEIVRLGVAASAVALGAAVALVIRALRARVVLVSVGAPAR